MKEPQCRVGKHGGKKLIFMAILLSLLDASVIPYTLTGATAADAPQSPVKMDEKRLIGRWVRPDGGYILELKEIGKDGTLKASYLNPRPIHVARAEYSRMDGKLLVLVELRDVNYPGSTYNLRYDPKSDRLIGTYFQAVQRETYHIEFMRVP